MKAAELVEQILTDIKIIEVGAPIDATMAQNTLIKVNLYMSAQSANGIDVGFTKLGDLGDTVTVPDGALMGMIANVAILMAGQFGAVVSSSLAAQAAVGVAALRKLGVPQIASTQYPDTLPTGSGNDYGGLRDSTFYHDDPASIETETSGTISLEP